MVLNPTRLARIPAWNTVAALAAIGCFFAASAAEVNRPEAGPTTSAEPAAAETTEQILTQAEYDIGRAYIAHDPEILRRIFADDFSGYSGSATKSTKADWLKSCADRSSSITTFHYSPFDIRVIGSAAIVQGSNDDDLKVGDKDAGGLYTWMDAFENRGGQWVLVANETVAVHDRAKKRAGHWVTITGN